MPPPKSKQTKVNAAKKEQIAEKVKEIQQRQKNWLRQRDEHLNTVPEPVYGNGPSAGNSSGTESDRQPGNWRRDSIEHTSQGADILRVHHQPKKPASKQLASQVSDKLNVKVKHGFGSWLQSRKDAENENHNFSNGKEHSSAQHGSQGRAYGDASPASSLERTSSNNPLSPAEFDWKADSIVARVKQDLGIRNGGGASESRHYEGVETAVERSRREKTFVQSNADRITNRGGGGDGGGAESEMNLSCHLCPVCSNLMNTVAVAPMLLVPCGHTVCRQCSAASACCQVCGTRTTSITTNIMLQQIITDIHGGGSSGGGASSSSTALSSASGLSLGGSSSCPGERNRDHYRGASPPRTTAKQSDVSYCQQLHNLRERQATLQEEARSQQRETKHIAAKVKRTENQVKAIAKEEECLGHKIQELQEQQAGLREHREEYTRELQNLQQQLSEAQGQAAMVTQCLTSLEHEIDKVQFLAEGQRDSYHHHSQYR